MLSARRARDGTVGADRASSRARGCTLSLASCPERSPLLMRRSSLVFSCSTAAFATLMAGCTALGLNPPPTPDVPATVGAQVEPSVVAQVEPSVVAQVQPTVAAQVAATVSAQVAPSVVAQVQATLGSRPSPTTTNAYPPALVQNFMDGCTRGGQASEALCGCTLQKVEASYTAAQFAQISLAYSNGRPLPTDITQMASDCALSTGR